MNPTIGALPLALVAALTFVSLAEQPAKKDAPNDDRFELVKKLHGDWKGKASHGDDQFDATVTYRITSAGSAVVETLFGGSGHEMITMYHLDGNDLLLTHYCAAGNQPRMKAVKSNNPKKLEFKFVDGTNLNPAQDMHMHELTMEFLGDDHIKTEWVTFENGKPTEHTSKFDLRRSKKGD